MSILSKLVAFLLPYLVSLLRELAVSERTIVSVETKAATVIKTSEGPSGARLRRARSRRSRRLTRRSAGVAVPLVAALVIFPACTHTETTKVEQKVLPYIIPEGELVEDGVQIVHGETVRVVVMKDGEPVPGDLPALLDVGGLVPCSPAFFRRAQRSEAAIEQALELLEGFDPSGASEDKVLDALEAQK